MKATRPLAQYRLKTDVYLLDTNILIFFGKRTYPALTTRLQTAIDQRLPMAISSIVLQELEVGVLRDSNPQARRLKNNFLLSHLGPIIPYDSDDALQAARIKARLLDNGQIIGAYDLLIAAQAVRRGLTVVTHDASAFDRLPEVAWQDWTQP